MFRNSGCNNYATLDMKKIILLLSGCNNYAILKIGNRDQKKEGAILPTFTVI